jgi:ABC-2 type transport system permease protein
MHTLVKLSWIELKLFVREPITVIFSLALPVIFLFVMGGVFGNEVSTDDNGVVAFRGVGPLDYYIPAYFGLVMMAIGTVALPVHLAGYRERGVLRRLRASSISVWSVLGSQLAVSFVIALIGSILVLISGIIAYSPHMPQEVGLLILIPRICLKKSVCLF